MKRFIIGIFSIVLAGVICVPSMAQQEQQPPPDQQQVPAPGPRGFGGPGMGPGRGRGMAGVMPGRGAAAGIGPELAKYQALRDYIEVVERFTELSRNPEAAGVAAVVSATDLLRQRGPEAAIDYFNKTLPDVKSPAIQRAIRIQLVDLYRASGQSEKAMEQLDVLMKAQP